MLRVKRKQRIHDGHPQDVNDDDQENRQQRGWHLLHDRCRVAKGLLRNEKTGRSASETDPPKCEPTRGKEISFLCSERREEEAENDQEQKNPGLLDPLFRTEARLTTVLSSPWSVLRSTCNSLPKIDPTLNLKEFVSVLRAGVQAPAQWPWRSLKARGGLRPCFVGGQ